MEQAEYDALVTRMERFAREKPQAYARRVYMLAGLGYGFLLVVVALLLCLAVLALASITRLRVIGIKLFFVVAALLWVVVRSLWVRLAAPAGTPLSRVGSPELFAMIDRLRERLQTPPVHHVLLVPELNCSVTQVPRLGLFGWHRNYLMLGLPFMKAVTPEQFEAVLAHELGHLSRGHARAGNWIYRLRLIWGRLLAALEEKQHWGAGPILKFFRWYIPYFQACSFPLARANEYEADAASVALTSSRSAAQALTSIEVMARYFDGHYWAGIHRAARDQPQPGFAPYADLRASAVHELPRGDVEGWLESALQRRTGYADTHPALADRLAAIGAEAELVLPEPGAAADRLLGTALPQLTEQFDTEWRAAIEPSWLRVHAETQEQRARLAELRALPVAEAAEERLLERAGLEEGVAESSDTALALRRQALERFPESLAARYALGMQLLQRGDEAGVSLMETVLSRDPQAAAHCLVALRDFWWRLGHEERAHELHRRYVAEVELADRRERERSQVLIGDRYLAHGLAGEALAQLRGEVAAVPHLRRAWLLRRQSRNVDDVETWVFAYSVTPWWRLHRTTPAEQAMSALQQCITLPAGGMIVCVDGGNYRFGRKFRRIRGTRVV